MHNIRILQQMTSAYPDLIRVITDHRLAKTEDSKGKISAAVFEIAPPENDGVPIPYRKSNNLTEIE